MNADEPATSNEEIIRHIRELIASNTADAPREPGVYRLPCGSCYVDYFISAEGEEHWLVPGDDRPYTRDTISIARHGDYPWARLRTLAGSARVIEQLLETGISLPELIVQLEREQMPRSSDQYNAEEPYRRALTEVLLARGLDRHEMNADEIRVALQRAGMDSPTDSDVQKVLDDLSVGDREAALEKQHKETPHE